MTVITTVTMTVITTVTMDRVRAGTRTRANIRDQLEAGDSGEFLRNQLAVWAALTAMTIVSRREVNLGTSVRMYV
jgi:hypothetical protein